MVAAIRCGLVCRECKGRCVGGQTLRLECDKCSGGGCESCEGRGWDMTSECPQQVARPMAKVVGLFDMADKGHLPINGGVLDQSAWFIEAYRYYERAKAKALE